MKVWIIMSFDDDHAFTGIEGVFASKENAMGTAQQLAGEYAEDSGAEWEEVNKFETSDAIVFGITWSLDEENAIEDASSWHVVEMTISDVALNPPLVAPEMGVDGAKQAINKLMAAMQTEAVKSNPVFDGEGAIPSLPRLDITTPEHKALTVGLIVLHLMKTKPKTQVKTLQQWVKMVSLEAPEIETLYNSMVKKLN